MTRLAVILLTLLAAAVGWCQAPTDSVACVTADSVQCVTADSIAPAKNWKDELRHLRININDTITHYPKFVKTVYKTARWVKQALYTYDTTYVEGFDNKWRFTLKCNNWFDTYTGHLTPHRMAIGMSSNITTKFGAHISYKGIGFGYMLNLKDVFTRRRLDNRRFDGSINTSRISVEWYYTKDRSDINIHRLGSFGKDRWRTYEFQGLSREAYGAYVYYFFNHSRYCQSAAYGISRHQRRSAGSFILGIHANHQDIDMDFDWLSEPMKAYLPDSLQDYRFTYRDYSVLVGYGYSWVPHPRWLINITAIPSLGLRHSHPTNVEGARYMLSTNIRVKLAVVLNRKKWSYGLNFVSDGHWYRSPNNSFFNSSQDINISVGFRL